MDGGCKRKCRGDTRFCLGSAWLGKIALKKIIFIGIARVLASCLSSAGGGHSLIACSWFNWHQKHGSNGISANLLLVLTLPEHHSSLQRVGVAIIYSIMFTSMSLVSSSLCRPLTRLTGVLGGLEPSVQFLKDDNEVEGSSMVSEQRNTVSSLGSFHSSTSL